MTRLVVIIGFVVSFAAGFAVGHKWHQGEPPKADRPSPGGWLAAELKLTPEQRKQLDEIWSETARRGGSDRDEHRGRLYRERDEAIVALIRPEDRPKYEAIQKRHAEEVSAMGADWRKSFDTAVARTKEILTPEQRQRYEELLARRDGPRDGHDQRGGGGHDWRRGSRPAEGPSRGHSRPSPRAGTPDTTSTEPER